MADLYLDADIKPGYPLMLKMRWHDVITSHELGQLAATDAEQLVTATNLNRILVTHNGKDFRTLCQAWRIWRRVWGLPPAEHAGVIAIPQPISLPISDGARHIDRLLERRRQLTNELWYFDAHGSEWIQQV